MSASESTSQGKSKKLCLVCGGHFSGINRCPKDGTSLVPINHDELVGQTIARNYEVLDTIGRGGMSVVYKAKHKLMKRIVALKVLTANDPHSVKRFQLEAQLAANLSHPNIVTVYDFGLAEDARPFLSMDFVEGKTLSAAVSGGAMPYRRALPLFIQACDALAYAHGKSVIHRDLKPSNFMLVNTADGGERIKLLDFGIAKQLEPDDDIQQLTASGQVFGSPLYMSPEQCLGQKLDARADLYSFGCVMYEVLTGRPPFVGKSPLDTMQMHVREDAKPFRQVNTELDIPRQLEHIVLKALERDLAKRYKSVPDLLIDLKLALNQMTVEQVIDAAGAIDFSPVVGSASDGPPAGSPATVPESQRITREGVRYESQPQRAAPPLESSAVSDQTSRAPLSEKQASKTDKIIPDPQDPYAAPVEIAKAGNTRNLESSDNSTSAPSNIPSASAAMRDLLGETEPPGGPQLFEAGAKLRAQRDKATQFKTTAKSVPPDDSSDASAVAKHSKFALPTVVLVALAVVIAALGFVMLQGH